MEMFMEQLKLVIRLTKENLNVSKYRNGDKYTQVTNQTEWSNLTTGACATMRTVLQMATYGKLLTLL
jgi:hypothetical protein